MNALVIGRGSMGRRRIRDLTRIGVSCASWDAVDDAPPPSWAGLDLALVCTPPLTKRAYVDQAVMCGVPCFTEADVEMTGADYPSATPLFTPWYELLAGLRIPVAAYTLHVGQHLADWHPGADLSRYYAAQRASGACREIVPFELIWLTELFGPIAEARAFRARRTSIANIDDVYQVIVTHESGVLGHLLVDAISRPAVRRLTLVSDDASDGTRAWDVGLYDEPTYAREARALVEAIRGGAPWPFDQWKANRVTQALHTLERTA